jgi:hypothetical protein
MKMSEYAQLAEITSGIAIVVTLILLILEIQGNTDATNAATYDSLIADLANYQTQSLSNRELWEAQYLARSGSLDTLSPQQLDLLATSAVIEHKHYERAFIQWQRGNLQGEGWERFERLICTYRGQVFEETAVPRIEFGSTRSFNEFRMQCVQRP